MDKDLHKNISPKEESQTENFLQLLMANHKRIYAYVLGMVSNRSDADDLMQETTTVMWRKFSEFEVGTDFVAWGVTIAKYRILSFRQKHHGSLVQFSDEAIKALQADSKSMLNEMDVRIDAMKKCMTKLGEHDSNLIQMRYVQDLTVKIVAKRIGRSIHTVYKSLARIHDMLLQCIRKQLKAEGIS
jgi:RNA polymerase sigma-70 factor (ECF subfamily)